MGSSPTGRVAPVIDFTLSFTLFLKLLSSRRGYQKSELAMG